MSESKNVSVSGGIGIGQLVATLLSWSLNHSVGWALVHGILGWLYLIYYAIFL